MIRDQRFLAEHRGGPLKKEQHRQLMKWACDCAEHVLPLFGEEIDERLIKAIEVAKAWAKGNASVGDARKASVGAHAVAREYSNPCSIAVARAVGHAVATAHMADHSLGPALYGLKAVKNAGKSTDTERKWQDEQLPSEIKELVLTARSGRRAPNINTIPEVEKSTSRNNEMTGAFAELEQGVHATLETYSKPLTTPLFGLYLSWHWKTSLPVWMLL
ncbi:MAG: hypothetical protein NTV01_14330 [Bacteroidia bacterium]|nr:hypothetical protein [Bacteroidia bacterium]